MPVKPTFWRSSLILSSHLRLGLPNGTFPSGFPTKTLYKPLLSLSHTCYMPRPSPRFDHPITIWWGYRSFSSPLCSFLQCPVTSPFLGPHIFLSTLVSETLILRVSLNVSDQVSHPYKTTGNIIIQCSCITGVIYVSEPEFVIRWESYLLLGT